MRSYKVLVLAALAAACVAVPAMLLSMRLTASDHADTAENFNRIGADMTDVFMFPSPTNDDNVVIVMDVHGLIPLVRPPRSIPRSSIR